MRAHLYILDDKGEPVAVETETEFCTELDDGLIRWGRFFEQRDLRRVALEEVNGIRISTVFLGIDHGWGGGPPVLWETMCFADGPTDGHHMDQETDRCSGSREQALAMHQRMVDKVKRLSEKEG
jgi:hypothetical protein